MRIKEINIIQFGKLKSASFTPGDGLTVVYGRNESGKSTLLAFIKFVLFGLARKNSTIPVGERERAVSWETGTAAGSLTVEDAEGKIYRIERSGRESARGAYADKVRIIDAESGEEVFSGEVPGEHFLGISAAAYDSMCNIKQLEAVLLNGDAVKVVIDNLLSSGDETADVRAALKLLDAERRRLLHTNGKGGLVYESEARVDSLRSELRLATVHEGEIIKNTDELQKIESSLAEAQAAFEHSQRLCDAHDDVIRLEKFRSLAELKKKLEGERATLASLDADGRINTSLSSYEAAARLGSEADALESARSTVDSTERELEDAARELSEVTDANAEGLSELISEHSSPRSAVAYLEAKRKKRSSSAFLAVALGITGGVLIAFALVLAFAMSNIAGAATVAFIGALLGGAAIAMRRRARSAGAELEEFSALLGEKPSDIDPDDLLARLEAFCDNKTRRTRASNSLESAKFRLSVARETLAEKENRAAELLLGVGAVLGEGEDAVFEMRALSRDMLAYLTKKTALENALSGDETLCSSLENELSRFNEKDIRQRITPELEATLAGASFEELKRERDEALQKTTRLSQYKAGIERNLAAEDSRRKSSDIFPELEAEEERLDALNMRLSAVKLAMESLTQASLSIKQELTPRIRARACENLAKMTGGKYSEIYIDDSLGLSLVADGETRHIDVLSRGSLDVAYFAVRLALIEELMGKELPPLFMDEPLSQLDSDRSEGVIRAVSEYTEHAQCVLFTCRKDDAELAKRLVPDVTAIEL